MAGAILKIGKGGGSPGGNDKELQYNNSGNFAGCAQLFWDSANDRLGVGDSTPAKQVSLTKCMELLECSGSGVGVIYKGADRFMHDYKAAGAIGKNIFVGVDSGNFSMAISGHDYHASYNVGVGYNTLKSLTFGFANLAFGYSTLAAVTEGYNNCGFGRDCALYLTTGVENCTMGYAALSRNVTGSQNVAIGNQAGKGTSGHSFSKNVLIGADAGMSLGNGGGNNIFIGYAAADNVTSGEKNIVIGYNLNALSATADSQLNIGGTIFGDVGATKKVGINTSTMNETLNVGGAVRLGTSALTNAGTIRWTGADFEGYTGAAWSSLTGGGQWTDNGAYVYPTGAPDLNRVEILQSSFDVAANRQGIRIEVDTDSTSDTYEHTGVLIDAKIAHTVPTAGEPIAWLSFHSKIEVDGDATDGRTWGFMDSITRGNLTNSRGHWGYHVEFDCNGTHSFADNEQDLTGYMCGNSGTEKMNDAFFFDASTGGAYAAMCITGNMDFGLEFIAPTFNTAAIAFGNAQHITSRKSSGVTNYQLLGMNASDNIEVGLNAPGLIILGYNAVSNNPINIWVGGVNKVIEAGAVDSGGAGFRMLRVAN